MSPRGLWDSYLRAYDALRGISDYRRALEDVATRLEPCEGTRILDAGSGTGNLSILLRGFGADVVSLDFSPVGLAVHRDKDPGATQVLASLESTLPFPDAHFDSVACASVLFALTPRGTARALGEFRRVLRPGGRLVVTVAKKRMSVLRLAWDHLLGSRLRAHTGRRLRTGEIRGLMLTLYYSIRIRRLKRCGRWRRFSGDELRRVISEAGLARVRCESTFGGRYYLVQCQAPEEMTVS